MRSPCWRSSLYSTEHWPSIAPATINESYQPMRYLPWMRSPSMYRLTDACTLRSGRKTVVRYCSQMAD